MNNNDNKIKNGDAMSGNEPTGARRRRTKLAVWLGVAGLCATGASLLPLGGHSQAAYGDPLSEGMECSYGDGAPTNPVAVRSFELTASEGYTSEPDGNAIYDWSYRNSQRNKPFQLPGPVLCVYQHETINITLKNELKVPTSIQFPGQANVLADGVADGPTVDGGELVSLAKEAAAGDTTTGVVYSFEASSAGTYLYESGSDPQLQVQMGLFGAIVVRPAYVDDAGGINPVVPSETDILNIPWDSGANPTDTNAQAGVDAAGLVAANEASCAYAKVDDERSCDPLAIYSSDPKSENILMLSEIDPGVHTFMEQNGGTPANLTWNAYPGAYEAHYFMINGRSMPDTVAPNNAPWLPSQPYGSLAHVQPWTPDNPLDVMLRYVAVGTAGYDFHPHSNHEHVIAQDGALMKGAATVDNLAGNDNTEEKFNIMVGPGSTVDATFRWTNEAGYKDSVGSRVPVAWPNGLNLQEGDFWSGSPYLGESGNLNPGILTKTQCGEYYHVAHNHDLTQVTNYGITFGGMLTLIKVEPPAAVQAQMKTECG